MFRLLCALILILALAAPAGAQESLILRTDLTFYGDNTEFFNPFRRGETLLGTAAWVFAEVALSEAVRVRGGVFGNHRYGSDCVFEQVRPVFALVLQAPRTRLIFGTLDTAERREGMGPDRAGPHGLLPPLQVETLSFTRPYEAGLQWIVTTDRGRQDAWLNWQRLNTPRQREQFDAGVISRITVVRPVALGFQWHIVHRGGQLHAGGPVADSLAFGPGTIVEGRVGALDRVTVELYGLMSRHVPDRGQPERSRTGAGLFARLSLENAGWRGHGIFWRACDFIKEEGDPNYLAIRRDGTRFRATRDYAEVGLARAFQPAPQAGIEASARVHRIERHYEYSYRVLATVQIGWPLLRSRR